MVLGAVGRRLGLAAQPRAESAPLARYRRGEGPPPPPDPKAITIKKEGRRYFVTVRCVDVPKEPLPSTGKEIGIDLGVVALVATSEGTITTEGRYQKKALERLANAQRELATKNKGSGHRRRAEERAGARHRKVRQQRKDLPRPQAFSLVNDFDLICVEDLQIKNMMKRPKPRSNSEGQFSPNGATAKAGLNRSIHDAGWGGVASIHRVQSGRCWS